MSDSDPAWLPDDASESSDTPTDSGAGSAPSTSEQMDRESERTAQHYDDEVLGIPLMNGEQVRWVGHQSRWTVFPYFALSVIGVVGMVLFFFQYQFQLFLDSYGQFDMLLRLIKPLSQGSITEMNIESGSTPPLKEVFPIPIFFWPLAIVVMIVPSIFYEMNRRWLSYVITNYRVMRVQTFPAKDKDWVEISDIKSFTSNASFFQRKFLGTGQVKFQPANNDNVVYENINNYEYWESKVKEYQRRIDQGAATPNEQSSESRSGGQGDTPTNAPEMDFGADDADSPF